MRPTLLALLLALPLLHCASADFTVADQALTTEDTAALDGAEAPEAPPSDTAAPPPDSGPLPDTRDADTAPASDTAVATLDTATPMPDTAPADTDVASDTAPAPDTAPALDTAPVLDTAPAAETGVPCTHCMGMTGVCPSATLDAWCWDSICSKRSTCYFTTSNVCHCGV